MLPGDRSGQRCLFENLTLPCLRSGDPSGQHRSRADSRLPCPRWRDPIRPPFETSRSMMPNAACPAAAPLRAATQTCRCLAVRSLPCCRQDGPSALERKASSSAQRTVHSPCGRSPPAGLQTKPLKFRQSLPTGMRDLARRSWRGVAPLFENPADCPAENGTAPGAGVERVTTERLRAAGDGKCAFTAPRTPRTLRCVGVIAAVEVTRPEAIDRTAEPPRAARATDCEFTKVERGTAVIAPATRWFAKWIPLTLPVRRIPLLTITVFLMLMLVMNPRLQRNPGKNGSPKPSGNHPIGSPNPKPKKKFDPPTKPTRAGAKNGRAMNGPGHQPQNPPANTQRP